MLQWTCSDLSTSRISMVDTIFCIRLSNKISKSLCFLCKTLRAMASLSTITQPSLVHIPGESVFHHVPNTCSFPWKPTTITKRMMMICSPARNSGETSAETEIDGESSTAVDEAPKESPSLISALNVERALRGLRNPSISFSF